jgi:hypothetical protein
MGYFGWGGGYPRASFLEVDISDEEEGMESWLITRSLIRALRSANCGMSILELTQADW